jgi:hypothetical protein
LEQRRKLGLVRFSLAMEDMQQLVFDSGVTAGDEALSTPEEEAATTTTQQPFGCG